MEIFDFLRHQDAHKTRMRYFFARARAIWRANRGKFAVVFMISLGMHVTVLLLLLGFQSSSVSGLDRERAANEAAFKRALAELDKDNRAMGGEINNADRGKDIRFNPTIGEKERTEIYKRLIMSDGTEYRLNSGQKIFVDKGLDDSGETSIDILENDEGATLRRLRQTESFLRDAAPTFGEYVKIKLNSAGKSLTSVPQEYFFRECPYEQILAKGASLFAIINGLPTFSRPLGHDSGPGRSGEGDKKNSSRSLPGGFRIFLLQGERADGKLATSGAQSTRPAEKVPVLTDTQIRSWLDEILALPESAQFVSFRDNYLKKYDADDPQLARIAREFIGLNLNTVYYFLDDFSLAFDGIEELYYKRDVYDQFAAYWQANLLTRTGEELALALGEAYDFERREITRLLANASDVEDILAYRRGSPSVFNPNAKAFVLNELRKKVERSLREMGITSIDSIRERYISAESEIYQSIAETPGPNKDRALWALGELYWDDMRYSAALDAWRKISNSFSTPVFEIIRGYLDLPDGSIENAVMKIDKAFEEDSYSGTAQMLRRQRQFKKWLNRTNRLKGNM